MPSRTYDHGGRFAGPPRDSRYGGGPSRGGGGRFDSRGGGSYGGGYGGGPGGGAGGFMKKNNPGENLRKVKWDSYNLVPFDKNFYQPNANIRDANPRYDQTWLFLAFNVFFWLKMV